jgi:hypothetical protein
VAVAVPPLVMVASSAPVGTWGGAQLPAMNQSLLPASQVSGTAAAGGIERANAPRAIAAAKVGCMARTLLMRRKICPVQTQGDDAATFGPNTPPGRQLTSNIRAKKTITDIS